MGFFRSALLLFMLLNPFLLVIYLVDLIRDLDMGAFTRILVRAGSITCGVFILFALAGDAVFSNVFQARFESFQIFGGIIFLIIGIRFVLMGNTAIEGLRGEPGRAAGLIAMPIMIGPGTVSASVVIGHRLPVGLGPLAIIVAVFLSVGVMILLKKLHDYVLPRNETIVARYIEVAGRITALFVGTFAIEMIMQGWFAWQGSVTSIQ